MGADSPLAGLVMNINTLSANRAIFGVCLPIAIPSTSVLLIISLVSGSMAILNSNGDKGHPCLVPRNSVKGLDIALGVSMLANGFLYIAFKKSVNGLSRPIQLITMNNQVRSTLSKALSATSVNMIVSFSGWCFAYSNVISAFLMFVNADLPFCKSGLSRVLEVEGYLIVFLPISLSLFYHQH